MNYNNIFDSIASIGKLRVEASGLTRDEKERTKSNIDAFSNVLKLMQAPSTQNTDIIQLDLNYIKQIKKVANQCSIRKVVILPYPKSQTLLFRVYDGDREMFFRLLNLSPVKTNSNLSIEENLIDTLESEYGIILYEDNSR